MRILHLDVILKICLTLIFMSVAYLFFARFYPHHLHYHEQYQLFLFDKRYILDVLALPGGVAELISRFLIQFFISSHNGAMIMASLLGLLQINTSRIMPRHQTPLYPLSFIPAILMWMFLCNENAMPTACISLIIALELAADLSKLHNVRVRAIVVCCATPLLYLMAGPIAVALPLCVFLPMQYRSIALIVAFVCPLIAQFVFPYPLARLFYGLHYFRFPQIIPWLAWIATFSAALLHYIHFIKCKS